MTGRFKVQFWDDERAIGNNLIVTLNYGWRFGETGEHVRGFDSEKEARQAVKSAAVCNCSECTGFATKRIKSPC